MTNGNEEGAAVSLAPSAEVIPPKSPKSSRKVSIALNAFARKSSAQDTADGNPPSRLDPSALMRRRSTFKGLAQSITNAIVLRRLTKPSIELTQKPKTKLENTYKMCPDDNKCFYPQRVREAIKEVLDSNLDGVAYNAYSAGVLTENLTELIKRRVKSLKFDRYKIICNVVLGQCKDQGLESASRCVWDQKVDNFACVTYKNKSLFAVATVYGIYYE